MSYALAVNEAESVWRVYCNVCRNDLGTMTPLILKRAMAFAAAKGGVMCPGCREQCCKICGIFINRDIVPGGFCWFCQEEKDGGMVLTLVENVLSS